MNGFTQEEKVTIIKALRVLRNKEQASANQELRKSYDVDGVFEGLGIPAAELRKLDAIEKTNILVRAVAQAEGLEYRTVWNVVYSQYNVQENTNVRLRRKHEARKRGVEEKKIRITDLIRRDGKGEILYACAYQVLVVRRREQGGFSDDYLC